AHQRAGAGGGGLGRLARRTPPEPRPGLPRPGEAGAGDDQGPGAPGLSARGDLRGGHPALPGRRLAAVAVDLRRLPAARGAGLPGGGARLLPAAVAGILPRALTVACPPSCWWRLLRLARGDGGTRGCSAKTAALAEKEGGAQARKERGSREA